MMTISGVSITRTGGKIPPLADFAYGLKQLVRFAGQTSIPWSVLDHHLACMVYARADMLPHRLTIEELYAGLHDAHEAFTNDVPRGFKTPDMEALQEELDERIFAALHIPTLHHMPFISAYVHDVDNALLVAEASVLGPRWTSEKVLQEIGERPRMRAVGAVHEVLHGDTDAELTWLGRITELLEANGGRAI